jgi:hypothetical protein
MLWESYSAAALDTGDFYDERLVGAFALTWRR